MRTVREFKNKKKKIITKPDAFRPVEFAINICQLAPRMIM